MRHSDPTEGTAQRQDKNVTAPSSLTVPKFNCFLWFCCLLLFLLLLLLILLSLLLLLLLTLPALPNSDWLDHQRANSLYDRLLAFEGVALSIHNIHLDFFVPKECYRLLDSPGVTIDSNKGKTLSRTIEKDRKVTYKLYPDGRALVYIKCSGAPFPIVTDSDVTKLIRFMEKAHYILSLHLHDTTN